MYIFFKLIHSYFRDYAEDNQDENSIKKPRYILIIKYIHYIPIIFIYTYYEYYNSSFRLVKKLSGDGI